MERLSLAIPALLVTALSVSPSEAEVFCNLAGEDDRFARPALPAAADGGGAIGYLNNGCTATLIDSTHILAAAHCFVLEDGRWQTGLRFYLDYHPAGALRFRNVAGAVVGSRVGLRRPDDDWGIARIDFPFRNARPLPVAAELPEPPTVFSVGYARERDFFPDGQRPGPAGHPDCSQPRFCGATWWQPALVDPECEIRDATDDTLAFDCATVGGNSGSPLIARVPPFEALEIVGVIHGGPGTDHSGLPADRDEWGCRPASAGSSFNDGPGATRFRFAPRRAADVAVAGFRDGSGRSQVLVSDSDTGRIVFRERASSPLRDDFGRYRAAVPLSSPGSLTVFRQASGRPQVIAASGAGRLETAFVADDGGWRAGAPLTLPKGVPGVLDLAGTSDSRGTDWLFALDRATGEAHYRSRSPAARIDDWSPWLRLIAAPAFRLTALSGVDGVLRVVLIDRAGRPRIASRPPGRGWSSAGAFAEAGELPLLRDVTATISRDGKDRVFGLDVNDALWSRPVGGAAETAAWQPLDVSIERPGSAPGLPRNLVALSAGRWPDGRGGRAPVLFAIDSFGNVYYSVERSQRPVSLPWQATRRRVFQDGWRSFY